MSKTEAIIKIDNKVLYIIIEHTSMKQLIWYQRIIRFCKAVLRVTMVIFLIQVFRNPIILIQDNRRKDESNKYNKFLDLLKPIVENQGGTVEYVNGVERRSMANTSLIDDFILKKVNGKIRVYIFVFVTIIQIVTYNFLRASTFRSTTIQVQKS